MKSTIKLKFRRVPGFTLLELLLVLFILSVVFSGLAIPLSNFYLQNQSRATQSEIDMAIEALYGFALVHGRLPCPDYKNGIDGVEDFPCHDKKVVHGILPWESLGVTGRDYWHNKLYYAVTSEIASNPQRWLSNTGQSKQNIFDFEDDGAITILERSVDKNRLRITNNAAAIVISLGRNAIAEKIISGIALNPNDGQDERENTDMDRNFVRGTTTRGNSENGRCDDENPKATYCEFDDLLQWIPTTVLKSRMVQAGRFP